jgi:hypothetical protein
MTKFECLNNSIVIKVKDDFDLGYGDIYGIDILFNNMYYNKEKEKI